MNYILTTHLIKFKNILTSPCTVLTAPGHYMTDNRVMFGLPTVPGATPGASGLVQQPVAPALTVTAARPPAAAAPAAAPCQTKAKNTTSGAKLALGGANRRWAVAP